MIDPQDRSQSSPHVVVGRTAPARILVTQRHFYGLFAQGNAMSGQNFVDKARCARHTIFPGVNVFTAAGNEMMLSLCEFEPNAVVEEHAHPHEQVGIVVAGHARFFVGNEERVLGPGDMYIIPGDVPHRVAALEDGCKALDVFHPIREEYL